MSDLDSLFAYAVFAATIGTGFYVGRNALGILSWQTGIPLYYGVYFGLFGAALVAAGRIEVDSELVAQTYLIAAAGIAAFSGGVLLARLVFRSVHITPLSNSRPFRWLARPENVVIVSVLLLSVWPVLVAGSLFNPLGVEAERGRSGPVNLWNFMVALCLVRLWQLWFAERNRACLVLGIVTMAVLEITALFLNSKTAFVLPFVYVGLSYYLQSGTAPIGIASFVLVFYLFIVYPLVTISRTAQAYGQFELATLLDTATQLEVTLIPEIVESSLISLSRFLFEVFSIVVDTAGRTAPLYEGKTITDGVLIAVPSAIYPDKPVAMLGNMFAIDYSIIPARDQITNISPTYMGEFFMNYLIDGLLVGMACVGVLAYIVDKYVIGTKRSYLFPIFIVFIGWQESYLGHTLFPFITLIVVFTIVLTVLMVVKAVVVSAVHGK